MNEYRIALYPGDGIGLEVTPEAMKIARAAAKKHGFRLSAEEFDWGHRHWRKNGRVVPGDFIERLRGFDAIFLGALGDPENLPDHLTLEPLLRIRQEFDQYACVRPARSLPGVRLPLAGAGKIDLVVIRENSEGEYINSGGLAFPGQPGETALQTAVHTRRGVTRILRYAFETAAGYRRRLTMATKSNALPWSMVLWDSVLGELQPEYPSVEAEKVHVDALAMRFVRDPEKLGVVVASNLFGDILSDLAGAITGSIGLAPSASINPERTHPSLFEPVHGSAPDIAGRGIANPVAAVRSAAMMLDFLGEKDAAREIEAAVAAVLAGGTCRTPDLGGKAGTAAMGREIAARLAA